jgi:hypothetical protein
MKKFGLALAVATVLSASATLVGTVQAAPAGPSGQLGAAADGLNMMEKAQFIFGGRRYCWYDNGWQGPGWYWCGYAFRQGFGWGGGIGWHGWRGGGRRGGGFRGGGRPHGGGHHHH